MQQTMTFAINILTHKKINKNRANSESDRQAGHMTGADIWIHYTHWHLIIENKLLTSLWCYEPHSRLLVGFDQIIYRYLCVDGLIYVLFVSTHKSKNLFAWAKNNKGYICGQVIPVNWVDMNTRHVCVTHNLSWYILGTVSVRNNWPFICSYEWYHLSKFPIINCVRRFYYDNHLFYRPMNYQWCFSLLNVTQTQRLIAIYFTHPPYRWPKYCSWRTYNDRTCGDSDVFVLSAPINNWLNGNLLWLGSWWAHTSERLICYYLLPLFVIHWKLCLFILGEWRSRWHMRRSKFHMGMYFLIAVVEKTLPYVAHVR